ncbi:ribosomal small subunit pseudouridine synthase A family protein [Veillonella sp. oral taxon 780 str. F0422]|nr:ribosomal small subunit pseudouridine synthase A family protein [Veillonella sp. oral taxon 780 str. F0422]
MNEFGEIIHSCELTIYEGKYHQVKRMIGACGGTVTYLQRIAIDRITLDSIEEVGTFIDLTEEEKEISLIESNSICHNYALYGIIS